MGLKKYLNYDEIEFLSEGFRSKAYKIDNKYVFLEGIKKDSYKSYKKDKEKIKFLKNKIKNIEIPSNIILFKKDKQFKYGGLICSMIKGKTFNYEESNLYNLESIAKSLADFLNQLHNIKVSYNKEKILNKEKRLINENIKLLKEYFTEQEFYKLLEWKRLYFKYLNTIEELNLVHGDLWYENLIISKDGKKLNGIIDFENMTIFIKGVDLSPSIYISEEFLDKVLKYYKHKITKNEIYLLHQRREIISFKNMVKNFPEEILEQIEKIKSTLEL